MSKKNSTKKNSIERGISRRDTLKMCLLPAGAWIVGCSGDKSGTAGLLAGPMSGQGAGTLVAQAGTTAVVGAAGAGTRTASAAASANAPTLAANGGSGGDGARAGVGASAQPGAAAGGSAQHAGTGGSMPGSAGARAGSGGGGGAVSGADVPWASGGTKVITGSYPDPFTTGAGGMACTLYPAQTIGPCYAQMPTTRQDISDGVMGLPLRVSFQVVRSGDCSPVSNASIDVWHSGSDGIYSSFATGTICNPGQQDVHSQMFCRGVQITDANGRVDFSTVFPGWYTGRTIHIHFTLRINGKESVTSQLYFDDMLTDQILAQGYYATRGKRDTTNNSDFIFSSGGATPAQVVFSTAKRPDGVLHAWKTLAIA
jgi:protocatechuate 3,4-dioxygenase beta subunit